MKTDLSILQHGIDWTGEDVSGYYGSEKLEGCRAYWTGHELLSRSGRRIQVPEHITRLFPVGVPIDGELYAGVDGFQLTSNAARYGRFDPRVRFVAFDAPEIPGDWKQRITYAWQLNIECVDIIEISNLAIMVSAVKDIAHKGGEGLMLHKPGEPYHSDCVDSLLKVKT